MTKWSQLPWEAFQAVGQVQRPQGGMSLVVLKVRQEAREQGGKGVIVAGSHRRFWTLGRVWGASEQGRVVN